MDGQLRERKLALPAIFLGLVALRFVFCPSFRGFLPDFVYQRPKNKLVKRVDMSIVQKGIQKIALEPRDALQ